MIDQRCCANLCDKLFFAVVLRTKEGSLCQAIQSGGMSSRVGQLMEDCAVVFSSAHELLANGKNHFISGRSVEGFVALLVEELHLFALQIAIYDLLGFFDCFSTIRHMKGFCVLCADPFALVDVEDIVVAQEGDFLLFASLFIFLLNPLPEDNHMGLLALLHPAPFLLALVEGDVLARATQKHLVQEAVRLASGMGNTVARGNPGLFPGDDALFHFSDNSLSDFLVDVHASWAVIYDNNFYYLLAYDGKKMRVYRIDHMEGVEIEEAEAEGLEEFKKIKLSDFTKQTFGMYSGELQSVTMRFPNNMVGTVLDRFGREVTLMKADDRHFRITVPIAVSPQFYGWVFGLKNMVTIESPQSVVDGMKEMLAAVEKRYEDSKGSQ